MLPGGVGNLDFELLEPSGLKIAPEQLWGHFSCMLPGGVGNLDFEPFLRILCYFLVFQRRISMKSQ